MSFLTSVGMGRWMDLKNEIKVGDIVICINEPDLPNFIGSKWTVIDISIEYNLYYCENKQLYTEASGNGFPFRPNEIVLSSLLMEELI